MRSRYHGQHAAQALSKRYGLIEAKNNRERLTHPFAYLTPHLPPLTHP